MKKLLGREPTPEMVAAVAKALMTPTDRWASDVCAAVFDAAPALPEPGEVEKWLRSKCYCDGGHRGTECIPCGAADLIAALQQERNEATAQLTREKLDILERAEKAEAECERLREEAKRYCDLSEALKMALSPTPGHVNYVEWAKECRAAIDADLIAALRDDKEAWKADALRQAERAEKAEAELAFKAALVHELLPYQDRVVKAEAERDAAHESFSQQVRINVELVAENERLREALIGCIELAEFWINHGKEPDMSRERYNLWLATGHHSKSMRAAIDAARKEREK